jgi:hypothetical protein
VAIESSEENIKRLEAQLEWEMKKWDQYRKETRRMLALGGNIDNDSIHDPHPTEAAHDDGAVEICRVRGAANQEPRRERCRPVRCRHPSAVRRLARAVGVPVLGGLSGEDVLLFGVPLGEALSGGAEGPSVAPARMGLSCSRLLACRSCPDFDQRARRAPLSSTKNPAAALEQFGQGTLRGGVCDSRTPLEFDSLNSGRGFVGKSPGEYRWVRRRTS